ncbi:MAG TPA: proton-conducting transporter membrane subunit [Sandaracinaceae bacterium LLY-WYZ-13_1]|nr:proton-conducting transporter membrane subunit [Sandaracinaceae bacterium LLY-WYZ-13_1]
MSIRNLSRIALVTLAVGLTATFACLVPDAARGEAWAVSAPWIPSAELAFALRLDALSLVFALIVTGVGAAVFAYAASYQTERTGRFHALLALFMVSMLGVVLADDLVLLYVFWELTSITSFFLVGFEHGSASARHAARHALLVTVLGGLCLLAGLILVGAAAGTTRISELLERGDLVREHGLYLPALVLIVIGASTKSAQVPFHGWLPRAMDAPTPASAYLHAATMVKAGIYLLARLSPVLGGTAAWSGIVITIGALTMVVGAVRALGETHLKRMLAYSTVAVLGMLTTLLGVGGEHAVLAALLYLVAHALYKGGLFLYAGAVQHEAGVSRVTELAGLLRAMPRTAVAGALAAASMAGVPPLIGFLGKDVVYAATLPDAWGDALGWTLLGVAFVNNALMVAVAIAVAGRPLLQRAGAAPDGARDGSIGLWAPPLALGLVGLVAGLLPGSLAPLLSAATETVAGAPVGGGKMALHGFTPQLAVGLATLAAGAILFALRGRLRRAGASVARALRLEPAAGYEQVMRVVSWAAERQTDLLQSGVLRHYLAVTVAGTGALVLAGVVAEPPTELPIALAGLRASDVGLALLVALAALAVTQATSRFTAIAAMGTVGLGVALVFHQLGAPDIAMTQFVVDVLNVVVFVAAFHHLPRLEQISRRRSRVRDAALAIALGAVMATVVLATAATAPDETVSDWLVAASVPQAHGRNVVNVILTDFRAIDTLGEITVLATAAFGVVALLRLRIRESEA